MPGDNYLRVQHSWTEKNYLIGRRLYRLNTI